MLSCEHKGNTTHRISHAEKYTRKLSIHQDNENPCSADYNREKYKAGSAEIIYVDHNPADMNRPCNRTDENWNSQEELKNLFQMVICYQILGLAAG